VLDRLELVDGAAEGVAPVDEFLGLLDGGRGEPEPVAADDDAAVIEEVGEDVEAAALAADDVLLGDEAVLEDDVAPVWRRASPSSPGYAPPRSRPNRFRR